LSFEVLAGKELEHGVYYIGKDGVIEKGLKNKIYKYHNAVSIEKNSFEFMDVNSFNPSSSFEELGLLLDFLNEKGLSKLDSIAIRLVSPSDSPIIRDSLMASVKLFENQGKYISCGRDWLRKIYVNSQFHSKLFNLLAMKGLKSKHYKLSFEQCYTLQSYNIPHVEIIYIEPKRLK
jgi:hypothetical protein